MTSKKLYEIQKFSLLLWWREPWKRNCPHFILHESTRREPCQALSNYWNCEASQPAAKRKPRNLVVCIIVYAQVTHSANICLNQPKSQERLLESTQRQKCPSIFYKWCWRGISFRLIFCQCLLTQLNSSYMQKAGFYAGEMPTAVMLSFWEKTNPFFPQPWLWYPAQGSKTIL